MHALPLPVNGPAAGVPGVGVPGAAAPGAATPVPGSGQVPTRAAVAPAALTLRIPSRTSAKGRRLPRWVSSATMGIAISVYPQGGSKPAVPQFAGGVGAPNCQLQSDGSNLCTFPVAAPVGNDVFDITLYDAAPNAFNVPQGNVLSHVTAPTSVAANATNALTMTLNGAVAAIAFSNARWTSSSHFEASVVAYDAAGQIIAGDNYDQPVVVSLTNAPGMQFASGGTTTTLNSPADNHIAVTFSGSTFNAPTLTSTAGGVATGGPAFSIPKPPAAVTQVPFVIPAAQRGDLALGIDANSAAGGASGFLVVPGSTLTDNEQPGSSFFIASQQTQTGLHEYVTVLADGSVAAAQVASLYYNGGPTTAVEVDLATALPGGQLNGAPTTFFTDLCQLTGATADSSGGLLLLGQNACGIAPGSYLGPAAARRHPLGARRVRNVAASYAIEVFSSASTIAPHYGTAPSRSIGSASLLATAAGVATDASGRIYVANAANGGEIDIFEANNNNGDAPDAVVPVQFGQSPRAIAVDAFGRIALLLYAGEGSTATLRLFNAYPGVKGAATPLVDTTLTTTTFGSPTSLAFDRFNNLWLGGYDSSHTAGLINALRPFPVTVPAPFVLPSPGASQTLLSTPFSIGTFPTAINASPLVSPSPSPSPTPMPIITAPPDFFPTPTPSPTSSPTSSPAATSSPSSAP